MRKIINIKNIVFMLVTVFSLIFFNAIAEADNHGEITSVDVQSGNLQIIVSGTTEENVTAVSISVYKPDGETLVKMKTSSVNDENKFSETIPLEEGTYVVKVANYDEGNIVSIENVIVTHKHVWKVIEDSIGDTTADYKCEICGETEEDDITFADGEVDFNGQKLKCILQDPYKILPDDTEVRVTLVERGTVRYNELLAQLDNTHRVEKVAFFEVELYDGQGKKIEQMPLRNKVRILLQVPEGWDKEDLETVLVMAGADVEFEEIIITIDGIDYLAFWTDHFSPYALIDKLNDKEVEALEQQNLSKSVATPTGESNIDLYIALSFVSISAATMVLIVFYRKRKIN